jgi:hypothetical protein
MAAATAAATCPAGDVSTAAAASTTTCNATVACACCPKPVCSTTATTRASIFPSATASQPTFQPPASSLGSNNYIILHNDTSHPRRDRSSTAHHSPHPHSSNHLRRLRPLFHDRSCRNSDRCQQVAFLLAVEVHRVVDRLGAVVGQITGVETVVTVAARWYHVRRWWWRQPWRFSVQQPAQRP